MTAVARSLVVLALFLASVLGHAAFAGAIADGAVERLIAADRQSAPLAEKIAAIRSIFDQMQPAYRDVLGNPPGASLPDLENTWRVAGFMAYVTDDRQYTRHMMAVHDEYARRGLVPPMALRDRLLQSLIAARQFDEARSYAARARLEVEVLPPVEGVSSGAKGSYPILRVDAARSVLRRENVEVGDELHVFVVSFIGCAYSRRAADAIENHEALRRFMREHSTWVTLPGRLHFNDVLAWNRQHPSTGFAYIDGMESWGFVDDWGTPTFYFVRQGHVVSKLTGWPDDATGISDLLAAISRSGATPGPLGPSSP